MRLQIPGISRDLGCFYVVIIVDRELEIFHGGYKFILILNKSKP